MRRSGRLAREAITNLVSSSDLNVRRHEVRSAGSLDSLKAARDEAWREYVMAEGELIGELNQGLFPGEHRTG